MTKPRPFHSAAFLCGLTLHERETLNFINQRPSFFSFVIIYHILHYIIHPSTLLPFHPFEFRDTGNMTMNDATEGRCIAVTHVSPSTFSLPLPGRETGIIHSNNQPICVKISMLNTEHHCCECVSNQIFPDEMSFVFGLCLCTYMYPCVCTVCHVGISAVPWDLDMKRERYEEKFYEKKEILW